MNTSLPREETHSLDGKENVNSAPENSSIATLRRKK